ncbi:hypothetical protein D3C87_2092570 [compost metagenome]
MAIDGLVSLPATFAGSFIFFDWKSKIPPGCGNSSDKFGSGFCMNVCGAISCVVPASAFASVLAGV